MLPDGRLEEYEGSLHVVADYYASPTRLMEGALVHTSPPGPFTGVVGTWVSRHVFDDVDILVTIILRADMTAHFEAVGNYPQSGDGTYTLIGNDLTLNVHRVIPLHALPGESIGSYLYERVP